MKIFYSQGASSGMNFNKAIVAGNLTRDVELRSTPSGQSVANFSVATNRFYTDSAGQKQTEVEFHNIVAWGKLAELCNQYLAKGRSVLIEGRLKTRSWQDQSGQTKYRTEIIAETIQFGPKPGGGTGGPTTTEEQIIEEPINNKDNEEIKVEDIPF